MPADSNTNDKESEKYGTRISIEQREEMLKFMMENPDFATGRFYGGRGELLREFADHLNSIVGGKKTPDRWLKSWQDWKCDVKAKKRGAKSQARGINALEERLFNFLSQKEAELNQSSLEPLEITTPTIDLHHSTEIVTEEIESDPQHCRIDSDLIYDPTETTYILTRNDCFSDPDTTDYTSQFFVKGEPPCDTFLEERLNSPHVTEISLSSNSSVKTTPRCSINEIHTYSRALGESRDPAPSSKRSRKRMYSHSRNLRASRDPAPSSRRSHKRKCSCSNADDANIDKILNWKRKLLEIEAEKLSLKKKRLEIEERNSISIRNAARAVARAANMWRCSGELARAATAMAYGRRAAAAAASSASASAASAPDAAAAAWGIDQNTPWL